MTDRYIISKEISQYTNNIPNNQCILDDNSYHKFILESRIGSNSKYGHVYKMRTKDDKYSVAVKIMDDSVMSKKEIGIFKKIKKNKKKNIHLPIIYNISYCNISNNKNIWLHSARPTSSSSIKLKSLETDYYIVLNELAEGDLKHFVNMKQKKEILENVFVQVMMCILSFHNLGYKHLDTHWGNFLYHKVEKKGYIRYKIEDKEFYIKNEGYIFTIWDFGFAKKKNEYPDKTLPIEKQIKKSKDHDYLRILKAFIPKKDNGWNTIIKNNTNIVKLYDYMKEIITDPRKSYEKIIFNYLIENNFFLLSIPKDSEIIYEVHLKYT